MCRRLPHIKIIFNQNILKYLLVFIFISSKLFANTITSSIHNEVGESSYIVKDRINLAQAKLIFPISSTLYGISYAYKLKEFTIKFYANNILKNNTSKNNKDFDWINNELVIYSESKNTIQKNRKFILSFYKNTNHNLFNNCGISLENKSYLFISSNTKQIDLKTNTEQIVLGNTLKYKQTINKLSLDFIRNKKRNSFQYKISINYYFINSEDTHILRDIKMTTYSEGFGYLFELGYKLNFNKKHNISITYSKESFQSNIVDMNYYKNNSFYKKHPSSIKIYLNTIGLNYSYIF